MANVKIIAPQSVRRDTTRVAAYCCVSSDSSGQLHSYAAQIKSYTEFIGQHKGWELVDIYADEGLTGTRLDRREDFMRMMNDARKGKIDKVLVKRKVMRKSGKTEQSKYSAKYALSELLACGECGTPYKRVTWARNGRKRVVWRCISRLEYGTQYCHSSPTLDEEKLHTAILAALNQYADIQEAGESAWELARLSEMRERLRAYNHGFTDYDDTVTRQMIEKITVLDAETVRIRFRDVDVELDETL